MARLAPPRRAARRPLVDRPRLDAGLRARRRRRAERRHVRPVEPRHARDLAHDGGRQRHHQRDDQLRRAPGVLARPPRRRRRPARCLVAVAALDLLHAGADRRRRGRLAARHDARRPPRRALHGAARAARHARLEHRDRLVRHRPLPAVLPHQGAPDRRRERRQRSAAAPAAGADRAALPVQHPGQRGLADGGRPGAREIDARGVRRVPARVAVGARPGAAHARRRDRPDRRLHADHQDQDGRPTGVRHRGAGGAARPGPAAADAAAAGRERDRPRPRAADRRRARARRRAQRRRDRSSSPSTTTAPGSPNRRAPPTRRAGSGTALANIRRRLEQTYGSSASLDIGAAEPHGVRARLSLPVAS